MQLSLFAADNVDPVEIIEDGACILRGLAAADDLDLSLLAAINEISGRSPFRHLKVPGGYSMSVAMTNCGQLGWLSDTTGYRYDQIDPLTGANWPPMPPCFLELADKAAGLAGFSDYQPQACLVNKYAPGAKLSLHVDQDEEA